MTNDPILITNPYDNTVVNVEPLLRYLHEQGRGQVTNNLKATYRYISTTPIDVDLHSPVKVAAMVNDLFELEDVFAQMVVRKPDEID